MSDTVLRQRLIRVASQLPKGSAERRQVLALLTPDTLRNKVAVNQKTQDFVEWVTNTDPVPMTEAEIVKFVKGTLRMEIKPPVQKREGARFQVGDRVQVKKDKHKDEATSGPYIEFNGKIGTVVGVDGLDALVKMDSGPSEPVRFVGALKPRGVGLFKYTPAFVMEGSVAIEMVYYMDAEADVKEEQAVVVNQYMNRARQGEKRSMNYYTGHLFNARLNQAGQVYFQMFPQQRVEVDPESEAGFLARSFNPSKGKVLYIGRLNTDRPSGWEGELEKMRATAGIKAEK
jgi:ribosomal protein L21E